jgi:hypothetical protein
VANILSFGGQKATCGPSFVLIVYANPGRQHWPGKSRITHITQPPAPTNERRSAKRYRMNTAVIFHWRGPDNKRFQGEGATRDLSVEGVFVLTATCPPANAHVHMEVILPLSDGVSKAQMKADMTVLRVEHNIEGSKRSGFSAVGKGFLLGTFSDRASRVVLGLIKESKEFGKAEG